MAGYLSGFVWGGLFTAAGLAVVSELTLPGDLGAKAANTPVAPVAEATTEVTVTEPAAEAETEAPAEVAPEVTVAEPEVVKPAEETGAGDGTTVQAETPVEPVAESPAQPSETASETVATPVEPATAEAATPTAETVDLPPIVSVTADQARDQLAARQAELAPVAVEPAPVETAAEGTTDVAAVTEPAAVLPEATETGNATTTVAAEPATPAPAETAEAAVAEPAPVATEEATKAAEAALLETASTEMGSGDRAEMAEMDTGASGNGSGNQPMAMGEGKIGDGDASEGMMRSDTAALESAVSDEAPAKPPVTDATPKETAQPEAETMAPAKPEAEQLEVAVAPDVSGLTPLPEAATEDAPTLVTPPAVESEPATVEPAPEAVAEAEPTPEEPIRAETPKPSSLPQIGQAEEAAETTEMAVVEPEPEKAGTLEPARLGAGASGVVTGRMPQIGDDEAAKAVAAEEEMAKKPPVERFATEFENITGNPVISVVLMDDGASESLRKQVAELPFPVAVALDPLAPDVQVAAEFYRAAGVELIMLATGLPKGAKASDVEVTFTTHEQALPQVVAVMDTQSGGFQNDRPLATLVAPTVKAKGWGLITWDQGLNAGDQVAERENMAKGLIFRRFDDAGNNDTGIRRNLDRAALKAGQDGATIVTGTVNEQSLRSLVAWALEGKGKTVTMAPVSAALEKPEPEEGSPEATAEN